MHKKRRIWITLLALTVMGVIAGCVATAQTEQTVDPQAETATIKRGEISTLVSAQGNVTTDRQASLVFASAGRIADILVDTGDQVSEGDVLARLESDALDRQIERAEAALTTAQARLAQVAAGASKEERASALAALDAAQAGVEGAQARLDQLTADPTDLDIEATELAVALAKNQLWGAQAQRDAVAGNDYTSGANKDSAEAQVLVAEVGVTQAELAQRRLYADPRVEDVALLESQVRQAQAQVAQLQAQVDQLDALPRAEDVAVVEAQVSEAALAVEHARDMLDDLLVVAPFDGTVMDTYAHQGEWANPGQPVIGIADTEQMVLEVRLDEIDVAQLAVGQKALLRFDALPGQEVIGEVARIAPGATQTQGGIAYLVDVRFGPGDLPVKLGMTTNVDIVTDAVEGALLVPNRAVIVDRDDERYYLLVRDDAGKVAMTEVAIGLRDTKMTQVIGEVAEGDIVELPRFDIETGEMSGTSGLMGKINEAGSEQH